jgi:hypothetical protein
MRELSKTVGHESQEIGMAKKLISGKFKEFKFEMLEAKVEITARVKEHEAEERERNGKKGEENSCHSLINNELHIINELN